MEKETSKWIALNRGEYLVSINNNTYKICILDNKQVTINDEPYSVEFNNLKDNYYNLQLTSHNNKQTDNNNFKIELLDTELCAQDKLLATKQLTSSICIKVNDVKYKVAIDDQRSLVAKSWLNRKAHISKKINLKAPMPGLISKIFVKEGDIVKKGELMFILEAMKMENEFRAIQDCKIETLHIKERTAVEKNDTILSITEG